MHHAISIRPCIIVLITLFALTSCGGRKGELRIKGEFKGLRNADLTIYSRDGVISGIDTLHIREGKIDWSCEFSKKHGTLTIVYPTFSTLTVFGSSGDVIKIEGDAKHLSGTKVSGNSENEAYTLLREQMEGATIEEKAQQIKNFIRNHPESAVTRFLQLEELSRQKPISLRAGAELPPFTLITRRGDTIATDSLKGKYTLIAFWANWRGGSSTMNSRIRRLRRQAKKDLMCISYNMDVGGNVLNYIERTDTITWHSYCDQMAFQSELVTNLGIRDIPYYILTDTTARIICAGGDWQKDMEPALKELITHSKQKNE